MDGFSRKRMIIMFLFCVDLMVAIVALSFVVSRTIDNTKSINIVNKESLVRDNKVTMSDKAAKKLNSTLSEFIGDRRIGNVGIREATYEESTTEWESKEISFLADVLETGSTYYVFLTERKDGNTEVSLTCMPARLAKNPADYCVGTEHSSSIDANMDGDLPYSGKGDFEGKYQLDYITASNKAVLELRVFAKCSDQEAFDAALVDAKNVIRDHGMDPEQVPIEVSKDYCHL